MNTMILKNDNNNNNNNKGNKWHFSFESKPFYQLIRINWNVYNEELVKQILYYMNQIWGIV